jgi:hypothetical protein
MCDEPLVRLPIMEFVDAVHLSHIQEANQRNLEPAIFCFEGFQLIKMRSTKVDGLPEEKKWRKKSYVRNLRREWVQNVEGLFYTYGTKVSVPSSELAPPAP